MHLPYIVLVERVSFGNSNAPAILTLLEAATIGDFHKVSEFVPVGGVVENGLQ